MKGNYFASGPSMRTKEDAKEEIEGKIKKSLRFSIIDGAFYSAMVGFGESFFTAFAIFLQATNLQIGLIGSLPLALGSISQLYSNRLIKWFRSRRRFVYITALLEGLMYIPIALVFFFGEMRVFHLIVFVSIYWVFGMIASAAWNSWIGDLVKENERGRYFGIRNKIAGMTSFFAFLFGGYVLQRFTDGIMTQYIGFVIIFALALISRVMSFVYLTKKYEPEYVQVKEAEFTFIDFLKQARFRNYGLLVLYLCLMNFSIYVAGPFFAAYMLYDLKFSYMTFTLISAIAIIVKYVSMPVWGKVSDIYGTRKVLTLSGFLMPIVPLMWFFSSNAWHLVPVQIYSGFVWAGFEITSFNFMFDTTTHEKRATCVSYYNALNGGAIIAGALIGTLIVKYNNMFWSKYLLVFLVSFALRYVASFIFLAKLKEVRHVQKTSYEDVFFRVITSMPTMGIVHRIVTFRKKGRGS
ncbi:MAG: MFS transporter [Nanoarchaeota archaeon]|nr:MFS transporter [Nanoarchaeota archaeon]